MSNVFLVVTNFVFHGSTFFQHFKKVLLCTPIVKICLILLANTKILLLIQNTQIICEEIHYLSGFSKFIYNILVCRTD